MKTSDTLKDIAPALVAFQAEVKDPRKDSDNPYFKSKYVELDGLMMAVRPVANKHGLFISQDVTTEMTESGKTKVWCRTRLTHSSGEFVESDGQFNIAKGNDPQSIGSSETYIRRYDLSAFLGIAWDKDDDGNAASQPEQQSYRKQQPAEKKEDLPFKIPYIKEKPNQLQVNHLEAMCQYLNKDVAKMCEYYRVESIAEMGYFAYNRAYKQLGKKLMENGFIQDADMNWHKV